MPAFRSKSTCRRCPTLASMCALAFTGFMLSGVLVAAEERLEASIADVAAQLPAAAQQALAKIEDTPRRLLALRAYLRARDSLTSRWSWSQAQIEAYEKSTQHAQMLAEIDKVTKRFEAQNPGYTLYVNTQVRSLDLQLQRWNENPTVRRLAVEVYEASRAYLASHSGQHSNVSGFVQFLSTWHPSTAAPLAAPGMSLHGQLRAIDFQVHARGRVIAGPDTSTMASVWQRQGWAQKVAAAVASSNKFQGPLRMPNEPWHFEYTGSAEARSIRDGSDT